MTVDHVRLPSVEAEREGIAVIGGSGLYQFSALTDVQRVVVDTPFGPPSDEIVVGSVHGRRMAFLPRHGVGHRLSPADVPFRANIYALRALGMQQIISVSAVGSLREHIRPGDLAIPDQLVDLTHGRERTFFGAGCVAHISSADPWCSRLRAALVAAAGRRSSVHEGGTYCCIEGPAFSTRAESVLYRQWQMSLVGMTAAPEAVLAREANACLAVLAVVTDYDCWRTEDAPVSADAVAEMMSHTVQTAAQVIVDLATDLPTPRDCSCRHALDNAVLTDAAAVSAVMRDRVDGFRDRSAGPSRAPLTQKGST